MAAPRRQCVQPPSSTCACCWSMWAAPLHHFTSTHQPGCRPNPSLLLRPHKAPPHTICSVAMDRSFMRDSSSSSDGITLIARLVPRGVWTAALAVTAAVLSCAVMMASVVSDRLGYICSYRHTVHHCTACHAHYLPHLLPPTTPHTHKHMPAPKPPPKRPSRCITAATWALRPAGGRRQLVMGPSGA